MLTFTSGHVVQPRLFQLETPKGSNVQMWINSSHFQTVREHEGGFPCLPLYTWPTAAKTNHNHPKSWTHSPDSAVGKGVSDNPTF